MHVPILLVGLFLLATPALAILDPHDETNPDRCRSCHRSTMQALVTHSVRDDLSAYNLLTETIDGVCLICHVKSDCCVIGAEHQDQLYLGEHGHDSGQRVADIPPAHRPRTLPVFNDRVTCNTCHLHDRQQPRDYKLVRLAVVSDTGVDWTALCHDCHDGY